MVYLFVINGRSRSRGSEVSGVARGGALGVPAPPLLLEEALYCVI